MLQELIPAHIHLDKGGIPYAPDYDDYYFSRQNGLDEARYVFLQGNHLPERWQQRENFVIAETGFGTGLNFLATWQMWQADPQRCGNLHYISIEKHPLSQHQLGQLHQHWPELKLYSQKIIQHYPPCLAGMHTLILAEGRLRLSLYFGDIEEALDELVMQADAWFLDGFAPARNESMWTPAIMQAISQRSKAGATLATFTAASQVRRDLSAAGFKVSKRSGFGGKREMLTAELPQATPTNHLLPAWFALPQVAQKKTATVIGGGVAGCQTAYALAQRGWQVTLIERHAALSQEASGNRAGVISPKMTAEPDWGERFYRQAFLFATQQLQQLQAQYPELAWHACGTLQLNHQTRELKRWHALQARQLPADFIQLLDQAQASEQAGIDLPTGGSFFPQAGYLYPASLCACLLQHPNITTQLHQTALTLYASAGRWRVCGEQQQVLSETAVVVIANGQDATQFSQSQFLPFMPVRGQTSSASATPASQSLRVTLGHEGYITPAQQGEHIFGASFERHQTDVRCQTSIDQANWQQLHKHLPELARQVGTVRSSHCAVRMTTPDRYPCVGALPDVKLWRSAYAAIRHGAKARQWPPAPNQAGLFIAAGFGSRGLSTSAWCCDSLAALINGVAQEPLPMQSSLYEKLHPGRFLLRALQQNRS